MRRCLNSRLDALGARVDPPAQFRFVIISPETWPAEELAAYDDAQARGDTEEQDAIIWRVTGQRVNRGSPGVYSIRDHAPMRLIELRTRADGPQ